MDVRRRTTRQASRLALATASALLAACSGGSPTGPSIATDPTVTPLPANASLSAVASARGLQYGCAAGAAQLAQDAAFAELVSRECGILVPENDLKWDVLRPTAGGFSFQRADAAVAFAQQHGMGMRGHALVWHEAMPAWFAATVRPDNAEQLLSEHISTVVGRYAGRIRSWDVVNEAIETNHGRADGLRKTVWLEQMGPGYIEKAFRMAAAADPTAQLVYNENGLEYSWSGAKRRAVLALLTDLRARGVPVHALGIQAHLNPNHQLDLPGLKTFLADVAALGLKVVVTEMDVTDSPFPADAAARDQAVADLYSRFMDAVLAGDATEAVVTWGLSDRYSWLHSYRPREDGLPVRGLPFDQTLGRKTAYASIAASLARATQR